MTVRAKFVLNSITVTKHWDRNKGNLHTLKFTPVTSGSLENEAFYAATPSGSIELSVLNDSASLNFELGKEYFVDFSPA